MGEYVVVFGKDNDYIYIHIYIHTHTYSPHCEKKGLFFPEVILKLNLASESSICSLSQFGNMEKHKKKGNLSKFTFRKFK